MNIPKEQVENLFQKYTNKKIQYGQRLCTYDEMFDAHKAYLQAYNHNLPNGVHYDG